ncbi:MAG TPA: carbohydrate ABC transporter permease [Armatimonadota bacterium]|jgi:multiple sugar transport system permease protein
MQRSEKRTSGRARRSARRESSAIASAVSYALMIALALVMITPFLWMVVTSLHPSKGVLPDPSHLVPNRWHWENYRTVLTMPDTPIGRYFYNTLVVCVSVVCGSLLFTSMAAYGFARTQFRGRDTLFYMFLATMMVPGAVTMIPVFLIVRWLGWLDTYYALIVPGLSGAFGIFLLRQFFMTLPKELDDAAHLDGCGEWTIYWRIALPLSTPALATLAAFTFIGSWTDFFGPLIYTSSNQMHTLEIGLSVFKDAFGTQNWPLQMTAAVIVLIPCLIIFLFTQRFFVKGITMTGLKG